MPVILNLGTGGGGISIGKRFDVYELPSSSPSGEYSEWLVDEEIKANAGWQAASSDNIAFISPYRDANASFSLLNRKTGLFSTITLPKILDGRERGDIYFFRGSFFVAAYASNTNFQEPFLVNESTGLMTQLSSQTYQSGSFFELDDILYYAAYYSSANSTYLRVSRISSNGVVTPMDSFRTSDPLNKIIALKTPDNGVLLFDSYTTTTTTSSAHPKHLFKFKDSKITFLGAGLNPMPPQLGSLYSRAFSNNFILLEGILYPLQVGINNFTIDSLNPLPISSANPYSIISQVDDDFVVLSENGLSTLSKEPYNIEGDGGVFEAYEGQYVRGDKVLEIKDGENTKFILTKFWQQISDDILEIVRGQYTHSGGYKVYVSSGTEKELTSFVDYNITEADAQTWETSIPVNVGNTIVFKIPEDKDTMNLKSGDSTWKIMFDIPAKEPDPENPEEEPAPNPPIDTLVKGKIITLTLTDDKTLLPEETTLTGAAYIKSID